MSDEKFKSIRVSNSGPHAATVSVSIPYTIGARAQQHEDERAQWAARMRVLEHERAEAVEAARVAREERDAALARVDALLLRASEVKP